MAKSGGSKARQAATGAARSAATWMHRLRLRTFAWVVGLIVAGFTVTAAFALPALPVLGVAFAAAAVLVNQMAHRLAQPTCYGCGKDIARIAAGAYGVVCPDCGAITQVLPRMGGGRQGGEPRRMAGVARADGVEAGGDSRVA